MKENEINQGLDDRITFSWFGIHSITQYKTLCQVQGKELEKRNTPEAQYYLVEDGTIVKAIPDRFLYYRLDLTNYNWVSDPNLVTLFYDTYLKYQELTEFEDYYPDANQDLNKGINL